MNINDLREKVKNGDFDDNELIDLVIYLERENQALLEENQKYKEIIDKVIDYLETKRIREKAIIDIDVLEGILKEVE